MTHTPTGTEARLCALIAERQARGRRKYGTTVEDNPLALRQWLVHSLEEKMDDCVYMLRAIEQIDREQGRKPIRFPELDTSLLDGVVR